MGNVINILMYVTYLTLGTYAVPFMRIGPPGYEVPYMVPVMTIIGILTSARALANGVALPIVLVLAFLGFELSFLFSALASSSPDVALSLRYAGLILSSFVVVLAVRKQCVVDRCVGLLAITSLAVFAYGCYGYITGEIGDSSEHEYGYFGVTYTTSTRNGDQLYFLVLLSIVISWIRIRGGSCRIWTLMIAMTVVGVVASGVLLSYSRGAWLAIIGILGALVLAGRRAGFPRLNQSRVFSLAASLFLLAGIIISILPPDKSKALSDRFLSLFSADERFEGGNSNATRIYILKQSFEAIAERPLGLGIGNARQVLQVDAGIYLNHAENVFVQTLLEQGVVGLVALIGIWWWVIKRLMIKIIELPNDVSPLVCLCINLAFLVFGLFNSLIENSWFWMVFGLTLAQAALPTQLQNFRPRMAMSRVRLRGNALP